MKLRHALLSMLVVSVLTVWVRERWAVSALEAAVFVAACGMLVGASLWRRHLEASIMAGLVMLLCLWAAVQLAAGWTVVRADTADACLYWLAATCLVVLGHNACRYQRDRELFLKGALIAGSVICLAGVLQVFTSDGQVFWLFASGYDSHVIGPFVSPNNYAAFVELLVPVALVLALTSRTNSGAYVAVAGVLAASVVASGSRAGTILVTLEAAAVFLLRRRPRGGAAQHGDHALVKFAVVASAFTLIVGYQYLWDRFSRDQDPFSLRREFLQSSLAMVRAEPLHGFGFGTWPSAYPQFAIVDTGAVPNHAHNEWVQWAAEGGLPAFVVMLGVFLWALRPALQSVWGIGVLSVFIHSLVDYPFLRLGLASWIFAFLGALAAYSAQRHGRRSSQTVTSGGRRLLLTRALAGLAVPTLAFAAFFGGKLAWADTLYRRWTVESLQRATTLSRDRADYEFALAQAEPARAARHLERAIALNAYFTKARIELALERETLGLRNASEQLLLEAARRDRRFAPAWALANFYFRNNERAQFWAWGRKAAEMSYGDLGALFDLCFLVSSDGREVWERLEPKGSVEHRYLTYLMEHGRLPDAHMVALRIARDATSQDRDALLGYIDAALADGRVAPAAEVWDQLCRKRLVPYDASAAVANGDFAEPILNRAFDWRLAAVDGATTRQTCEQAPCLLLSFSGTQPELCELMTHFLPLQSGVKYVMRFQYRTVDLPRHTGLYWSLGSGHEYALNSSESWASAEWDFPASVKPERLSFAYRRHAGTTRIEGSISLRNVQLERQPIDFRTDCR